MPDRLSPQNPSRKSTKPGKVRLDVLMVERGLAASRERAQAMLLAGSVRVNGAKIDKAGTQIPVDAHVEITGEQLPYVSRGGLKLAGALEDFGVEAEGKVCIDVGSSTGGFTDCLLQQGARRVYAVDVTIDQLDWKLRSDSRVVQIERNARYLRAEDVPEAPELAVIDVSFISVTKILPAAILVTAESADFLILVKPQFELERREVGKGGIVRDPALHQKATERIIAAAKECGLDVIGVKPSRFRRAEGNQEFFLYAHHR